MAQADGESMRDDRRGGQTSFGSGATAASCLAGLPRIQRGGAICTDVPPVRHSKIVGPPAQRAWRTAMSSRSSINGRPRPSLASREGSLISAVKRYTTSKNTPHLIYAKPHLKTVPAVRERETHHCMRPHAREAGYMKYLAYYGAVHGCPPKLVRQPRSPGTGC